MENTILYEYLPASVEKCLAAVRWIYRQDFKDQLKFKRREKQTYFELKKKENDAAVEEISYTATLVTAFKFRICVEKGVGCLPDELEERSISKRRRKQPQQKWLEDHISIIKECVKQGISLRETQDYIKYRFRREISHQKINEFIKLKKIRDQK